MFTQGKIIYWSLEIFPFLSPHSQSIILLAKRTIFGQPFIHVNIFIAIYWSMGNQIVWRPAHARHIKHECCNAQ